MIFDPADVARLSRMLGRTPTNSELEVAGAARAITKEDLTARYEAKLAASDGLKWFPTVKVLKYNRETVRGISQALGYEPTGLELRYLEEHEGLVPDDVEVAHGNLLVTVGLNRITNLIIGGGGAAFNNSQAFSGVGDSSTAAAVGDTTLNAATNKWYKAVDASNPTQSNGVITCNTTYQTTEGNYAWQEWVWGVATGTLTAGTSLPGTSPIILNHKVQSLGTKVSGAVWTLQATITLS